MGIVRRNKIRIPSIGGDGDGTRESSSGVKPVLGVQYSEDESSDEDDKPITFQHYGTNEVSTSSPSSDNLVKHTANDHYTGIFQNKHKTILNLEDMSSSEEDNYSMVPETGTTATGENKIITNTASNMPKEKEYVHLLDKADKLDLLEIINRTGKYNHNEKYAIDMDEDTSMFEDPELALTSTAYKLQEDDRKRQIQNALEITDEAANSWEVQVLGKTALSKDTINVPLLPKRFVEDNSGIEDDSLLESLLSQKKLRKRQIEMQIKVLNRQMQETIKRRQEIAQAIKDWAVT